MKKSSKRIISLILLVAMFASFSINAFAANACTQVSGNSAKTTTFTVYTGSRWLGSDKIKFTQTKGTMNILSGAMNWKTQSAYDCYTIQYKKAGDKNWTTKTFYGSSATLSLAKNTTYTIRIIPGSSQLLQLNRCGLLKAYMGWKSYPTWKVTSTRGINFCQ